MLKNALLKFVQWNSQLSEPAFPCSLESDDSELMKWARAEKRFHPSDVKPAAAREPPASLSSRLERGRLSPFWNPAKSYKSVAGKKKSSIINRHELSFHCKNLGNFLQKPIRS